MNLEIIERQSIIHTFLHSVTLNTCLLGYSSITIGTCNSRLKAIDKFMQTVSNTFQVRVYYEDTDAGGIVYYANYLKFCERARTEWLRTLKINQSFFLEQNCGFVVRKVEMDNMASAKLDDLLTVTSTISELKRASLRFTQLITNEQQTCLCKVEVVVAYVNLLRSKPCAIPNTILGALKGVS
jgi:acyl-CoA thioester hydrolase